MEYLSTESNGNDFQKIIKTKVYEMIKYSTNMLNERSHIINKELDSIKKDYQSQISKIDECFSRYEKNNLSNIHVNFKTQNSLNLKSPIENKKQSKLERNAFQNNTTNLQKSTISKNWTGGLNGSSTSSKRILKKEIHKDISKKSFNTDKKDVKNITDSMLNKNSKFSKSTSKIQFKNDVKELIDHKKKILVDNKLTPNNSPNIINNSKNSSFEKIINNNGKIVKTQSNSIETLNCNLTETRRFSIMDINGIDQALKNPEKLTNVVTDESNLITSDKLIKFDKGHTNEKLFKDKKINALYNILVSQILPINERIIIASSKKEIAKLFKPSSLVKDYLELLQERKIQFISKNEINKIDSKLLSKNIYPSKTAQTALNFITEQSEIYIVDKLSDNPEVITLFNVIYTILPENQNYEKINNIVTHMFQVILPKYNVSNLKILFSKVIYKIVFIEYSLNTSQKDKIIYLIENNQNLINQSEMSKIGISFSYLTFSIKEIYKFLTEKVPNTKLDNFTCRLKLRQLREYKLEEEKLKKKLNS